jgi:hypothetical protein
MKAEYDLSKMKSRRNPYAKRLKEQVTSRIGTKPAKPEKDSPRNTRNKRNTRKITKQGEE